MQGCQEVLLSYWSHQTLALFNAFYIFKYLNRQVMVLQKRNTSLKPTALSLQLMNKFPFQNSRSNLLKFASEECHCWHQRSNISVFILFSQKIGSFQSSLINTKLPQLVGSGISSTTMLRSLLKIAIYKNLQQS